MKNENENKEHDFDLPEVDTTKAARVHKSADVCISCEG